MATRGTAVHLWVVSVCGFVTIGILLLATLGLGISQKSVALALLVVVMAALGWLSLSAMPSFSEGRIPPPEKLAQEVGATLGFPYLQPWLQATILNPKAVAAYWHSDRMLRIEELYCSTLISDLDAHVELRMKGRNESTEFAVACPMLMFGGSVFHYGDLPQRAALRSEGKVLISLPCRSKLDTGQLQFLDMVFPSPLPPGEDFEIEQIHSWPTGMAAGEDTLWYPYAALFERPSRILTIDVSFDRPVKYLIGIEARLNDTGCTIATVQPEDVDGGRSKYKWQLDPLDNRLIYGLMFDRE